MAFALRRSTELLLLLLIVDCKKEAPPLVVEEASTPDIPDVVLVADTGVPKPDMTLEAKRVAERWDAAYNAHDASAVANNYAPHVVWYGKTVTQGACKDSIAARIAKAPTQTQSSVVDSVTEVADGVRVTVTTSVGPVKHTYYWHLVKSQSGGLRIDEEVRANM